MDKIENGIKFDNYDVDFLFGTIAVAEKKLSDGRFISITADNFSAENFNSIELDVRIFDESVFNEDDKLDEDFENLESNDREIITCGEYLKSRDISSVKTSFKINDEEEITDLFDAFIEYIKEIPLIEEMKEE